MNEQVYTIHTSIPCTAELQAGYVRNKNGKRDTYRQNAEAA
ncbi:MAG: hypothetical protein Q7U51_02375 [Methanoregula sp.]|nr:hypothetical protein [Methanoregula sp.]